MQPKLVIFDLDGTLIDGAHAVIDAMQFAFNAMDLPAPSKRETMDTIGLSLPIAVKYITNNSNEIPDLSESETQHLLAIFSKYFRQSRAAGKHENKAYDGAFECLKLLNAQDEILLAIATGKSRPGVVNFIETYRLENIFQSTYCATECQSKPHPEMIIRSMNDLGIDKANTVMIGDTSYDMQMAKSAGVYAIGVNWGYHSSQMMLSAGADVIVDDFTQLKEHIFKILDI